MFRTKKNEQAAAKSEFSAADRLAALRVRLSPAAQKGAVAARAYGPLAREKAAVAAALAAEAAKTYGPLARAKAQAAAEWGRPRVDLVVERAQPQLEAARGLAQPHVERVMENLAPRVDATRDQIVDEWLPKVSAAMATMVAANAARDQAPEVSERARVAPSVPKGDVVTQPKGSQDQGGRSRGKVFLALGVLAGIGAAVAAVMNRKPREDPWAAPLSDGALPQTAGSGSGSRVDELMSKATETAGVAREKASVVAAAAKEKATVVAGAAKEKATAVRGAGRGPAGDVAHQEGGPESATSTSDAQSEVHGEQVSVGAMTDTPAETGHAVTDEDLDPAEDLDARPKDTI
jgi:hypothetical protein